MILINDILDLSKVEAGQIQLEEVVFDLNDMVMEILSTFYVMADEKSITLLDEIEEGVLPIRKGDPTRLRQILVNLMSNAVKFTASGEIHLGIYPVSGPREPDLLRFTVADTGIGIPQEKLDKIFDKFIQVDSSSTRKFGGSGLGLSLCREFVELMQGKIWVESVVGERSRIFVEIPLPAASMEESRQIVDANLDHSSGIGKDESAALNGKSILVVDDSDDNILLLKAFLKAFKVEFTLASDGRDGVEQFKSGEYDLVLMDIQMPVMDGYMATRAIREWETANSLARTNILALTANALHSDVEAAYDAGCDGHLSKPIDKKSLIAMLARFL